MGRLAKWFATWAALRAAPRAGRVHAFCHQITDAVAKKSTSLAMQECVAKNLLAHVRDSLDRTYRRIDRRERMTASPCAHAHSLMTTIAARRRVHSQRHVEGQKACGAGPLHRHARVQTYVCAWGWPRRLGRATRRGPRGTSADVRGEPAEPRRICVPTDRSGLCCSLCGLPCRKRHTAPAVLIAPRSTHAAPCLSRHPQRWPTRLVYSPTGEC